MVQCETLELHEYESEICWCRSQLELGSSNFTGVRWTASFLQLVNLADTKLCDNTQFSVRASWEVRPVVLESDRLLPCTKGCPDRWFEHVPPKLKSVKDSSNLFLWQKMSLCACLPCSCFLRGLYRVDDTVPIVLTIHSSLSCNDDCP